MQKPFNNEKHLQLQTKAILERASKFNKFYLEIGGKLFDDYHASRVLPGFDPTNKINVIKSLKDESEIIIVINSEDIKNRKIRGDLEITYDVEVERLIAAFSELGLSINSVVFSLYEPNPIVDTFLKRLKRKKIQTYKHYKIAGYPQNISLIVSENGLGKNEYIQTTKKIIIVAAPGPGSGKMATCLSQLYHDQNHGISAGYGKYETFPVWNLPLNHPVNVAYEAATIDLDDVNMIDPFHLEHYGVSSVNYNRDVAAYPLLKNIIYMISGTTPYHSPTDMGVNMVAYSIENDEEVQEAARKEIIRRYYQAQKDFLLGKIDENAISKAEMLMNRLNLSISDRKCVQVALDRQQKEKTPAIALELKDGRIVTGKTSELLSSSSAVILNALKTLAKIPDDMMLLSPMVIEPIQKLKVGPLKNKQARIHAEEILIALAIQANTNPLADRALKQLEKLNGTELHSSCLLAQEDLKTFKKLGINVTEEATTFVSHQN